jgi:outer membrane protein assembly factor BamB
MISYHRSEDCMMRQGVVFASVLALASGASAGDWPEFRGPTGQGIVEGQRLPLHWGPTQNVTWKQEIPGTGWSSPVVVAGRVYLTTSVPIQDSKDQSLRALCLDARSGKVLWDVEVIRQDGGRAPNIHAKNSHASPTPLVQGERIYVHFGHQGTACLDLDGKVQWQNRSLTYAPVHGNGGSPVLVDDLLVFSGDGASDPFLAALDAKSGKLRWKTPRNNEATRKFSFSTPLVIRVKGQKQIISPASDMVGAYDVATGREIWRLRYDGYSVVPRPVYGKGLVFVSTSFDSPTALAVRPDGKGDVTDTHLAWKTRRRAPCTPSMLVDGDQLYMLSDDGFASCLDARTGKVHWQQRVGRAFSASPLGSTGRIYCLTEEGVCIVLAAGKRFKQLARNDLKEQTLASPAAAEGALFLRTEKHLYRIEEKQGVQE